MQQQPLLCGQPAEPFPNVDAVKDLVVQAQKQAGTQNKLWFLEYPELLGVFNAAKCSSAGALLARVDQKVNGDELPKLQAAAAPVRALPQSKAELQKLASQLGVNHTGMSIVQMQKRLGDVFHAADNTEHQTGLKSELKDKESTVVVNFGRFRGRKFNEVPADYLHWAIREVDASGESSCCLQLCQLAAWARAELLCPQPLSSAAASSSMATPTPMATSATSASGASQMVVPDTFMDMTWMVDQLRARFGDQVMSLAWQVNQSQQAQLLGSPSEAAESEADNDWLLTQSSVVADR